MSRFDKLGSIPKNVVIKNVHFSVFTPEEIKRLAVKRICVPLSFDSLGHPIPNGLYDKAMG